MGTLQLTKEQWVLLALNCAPLDRVRLMKTLFLYWLEANRDIPGYFEFEPYLYGPCSFELYDVLDRLTKDALIVRAPSPVPQWADYHLTSRGEVGSDQAKKLLGPEQTKRICAIASSTATRDFIGLLRDVYAKAPEFAARSVVKT